MAKRQTLGIKITKLIAEHGLQTIQLAVEMAIALSAPAPIKRVPKTRAARTAKSEAATG